MSTDPQLSSVPAPSSADPLASVPPSAPTVSPASPLVSATVQPGTTSAAPAVLTPVSVPAPAPALDATPTPAPAPDPNIPVSPLPPQAPADVVSGAVLNQLGQLPADPTALPAAAPPPVAGPSSAGKEGLSVGLPASTEIPLTALKTGAGEGISPVATPEVGAAIGGAVEQAPSRELEPEVEATQEKIQQREMNAPQETVIAAPTMPLAPPKTVSQPVVVLPLSEQGMQEGRKKSPQFSIRWLYTWCVRQIRKFSETLVVYRDK